MDVIRKAERLPPVSDLDVSFVAIFSAEWRISAKTFKHNGTKAPPVALFAVTLTSENFRSNIIRSANRRIRHKPSVVPPHGKDSLPILRSHGEIDGVNRNRVTAVQGGRLAVKEPGIVSGIVIRVEARRKPEIGEFDVAVFVYQNIVRFDVPGRQ